MADVVLTLGVPHTPLLWIAMRDPVPPDLVEVERMYQDFRARLAHARPDAIVLVSSDHFRQFATNNMPAFLIGKAPTMRGSHPNEERQFGIPRCEVRGDPELARVLLGHHTLDGGFDFAFSDELWLDHSYMIPLLYLTPDLGVPVVPIHTNCNAPPIPPPRRFAELGRYLRRAIQEADIDRRVAIVGSGHLSVELGGPRQFTGRPADEAFDEEALGWMSGGDPEGAVSGATYERMLEAGNLTFQFLNFITCLVASGGSPAAVATSVVCRFGSEPFLAWDETT